MQPNYNLYAFYDWHNTGKDAISPTNGGCVVNICEYTIFDNQSEFEDTLIYDKDDKRIMVGKVLPRKARNDNNGQHKTRQLVQLAQTVNPNQLRGNKNGGQQTLILPWLGKEST